eukprot:6196370-Pleurochrysis_carterae.AAC.1
MAASASHARSCASPAAGVSAGLLSLSDETGKIEGSRLTAPFPWNARARERRQARASAAAPACAACELAAAAVRPGDPCSTHAPFSKTATRAKRWSRGSSLWVTAMRVACANCSFKQRCMRAEVGSSTPAAGSSTRTTRAAWRRSKRRVRAKS